MMWCLSWNDSSDLEGVLLKAGKYELEELSQPIMKFIHSQDRMEHRQVWMGQ